MKADVTDPAATVAVEQATTPTGQVYTVNLDTAIRGSDEFDGPALGSLWEVVRPDDARRRVASGALVLTSQNGAVQTLQVTGDDAQRIVSTGSWAPRRSTSTRPRPASLRSTAVATRPTSTSGQRCSATVRARPRHYYTASTSAAVTSTPGEAVLSVADPARRPQATWSMSTTAP